MNYSEGPLEFNPVNNSILIVGHTYEQAIAEFRVPAIVKSSAVNALAMAGAPIQSFSPLLNRVSAGNPQGIDRIGGMKLVESPSGPQLLVNGYEYYDAPGDNTHTTLVVRSPSSLSASAVAGFYQLQGAAHTAGWMSDVPAAWRAVLGNTHITGISSGIPIISRTSVGPSAFAFNPQSLVGAGSQPTSVATSALLDFSLQHPLHQDLSNDSRANKLWTHISRAVYGFIVPGTRTYVTLGHSGGHSSGVCYKCTQNNGHVCGGYCAPDADDYSLFYWLWDVNDLVAVRSGRIASYDVRPYEYGEFPAQFNAREMGGGAFDAVNGRLFLTLQRADTGQGPYSTPPVIAVYKIRASEGSPRRRAPADIDGDRKTDFTVIRPGALARWFATTSLSGAVATSEWGYFQYDRFLDLDINGDSRADQNATRSRLLQGNIGWFTKLSGGTAVSGVYWGEPGDVPVSADFDGDAKSDVAIFRPSTGTWWVIRSTGGVASQQWGLPGDVTAAEDFDGDGKDDFAVWRPNLGMWAVTLSTKNYSRLQKDTLWKQWGLPGDQPMPGDYDGDGKADLAVWRNSDGNWYVCRSSIAGECTASTSSKVLVQQFGLPGDFAIKADFDGDGILDFAVWRPVNGTWYWRRSSDGVVKSKQWGLPGDVPLGCGVR